MTSGGGIQIKTRTVTQEASHGGSCDYELSQSRECNTDPCPVDCVMEDWTDGWGKCVCEPGGNVFFPTITSQQTRTRRVLVEPQHGGQTCPSHPDYPDQVYTWETRKDCSCDCEVTEWSPWSACSTGYGPWVKSRSREVISVKYQGVVGNPAKECDNNIPPGSFGIDLTGSQHWYMQGCPYPGDWDGVINHSKYPPVDCQVSEWGDWSECPNVCSGTHSRTRTILTHRVGEGLDCPNLVESKPCQEPSCTECADSYLVFGAKGCVEFNHSSSVVGRWHASDELVNGRPVYYGYTDLVSHTNSPENLRMYWNDSVPGQKAEWYTQKAYNGGWNSDFPVKYEPEWTGNPEYSKCTWPNNFTKCPSRGVCFHDNVTSDTERVYKKLTGEDTQAWSEPGYGCVPIPATGKPVVRITDAPIRDDGMDLNGLYYSNSMYNGIPAYRNMEGPRFIISEE